MNEFMVSSWKFVDGAALPNTSTNIDSASFQWFHCQRNHPKFATWLSEQNIPNAIIDSLLADDTRPRFEPFDDTTMLVNLRCVNLHQGAESDDMLSLRMLWHNNTLITTRKTPIMAISLIIDQLHNNSGPTNTSALFLAIIKGINLHISEFLHTIEEELDELSPANSSDFTSLQLNNTRNKLLRLRRYLKPQKYVLEDILNTDIPMLDKQLFHMKNSLDTIIRINESVEFYLEQLDLYFNHLAQIQSEKMNRNTYVLSVVAAIFLPAGFFTGLLGVNIGGIPGVESTAAFTYFSVGLAVTMGVELFIFKKLKFI